MTNFLKNLATWKYQRIPKPDTLDDGFVLIAVIWVCGLLAIIATAFTATVTSQIYATRNVTELASLASAASGMANLVAFQLASAQSEHNANGKWQTCTWNERTEIVFRIQDQGGLIDLNTASPFLVLALLQGLAGNQLGAPKILAAIEDFRDPDQQSVDAAGEQPLYEDKSYGPKNAPFVSPFELDQIPEIPDDLFLELQEFTTIHSQAPGIDLSLAPQRLLAVLSKGKAAGFDLTQFNQPSAARIFAVEAVAMGKAGGIFHRRMLVNILGQPEKPFAILEWRRARSEPLDTTLLQSIGPCIIAKS